MPREVSLAHLYESFTKKERKQQSIFVVLQTLAYVFPESIIAQTVCGKDLLSEYRSTEPVPQPPAADICFRSKLCARAVFASLSRGQM